jgi:heme-degrading monooxygenase HmoA
MPVTLINCFEVPSGREDVFFALWREVNAYMQRKPGYIGHQLHRALKPDAAYRFVNVATWASQQDFDTAHDEDFRALVTKPEWAEFVARPTLYEVVHRAQADRALVA